MNNPADSITMKLDYALADLVKMYKYKLDRLEKTAQEDKSHSFLQRECEVIRLAVEQTATIYNEVRADYQKLLFQISYERSQKETYKSLWLEAEDEKTVRQLKEVLDKAKVKTPELKKFIDDQLSELRQAHAIRNQESPVSAE